MPTAYLPQRCLLRLSGPDAEHFLHNLVTTDITALPPGEAWPGALLTPQGKILFDFLVWREDDRFVLETDTSQREALVRRLTIYRLRAAVDILPDEAEGLTVFWDEDSRSDGIVDIRFARAGIDLRRILGRRSEAADDDYDAARVAAGIAASGSDYALQDAFPHDVLMDLNAGLSFRKGCYVGQEVVSRMQHRGTARRRLVQVNADSPLPQSGTSITVAGKPVGALGTVAGSSGLAIVRIDRVGAGLAAGQTIVAGDIPVDLTLPAWSGLSFPTDEEEAGS